MSRESRALWIRIAFAGSMVLAVFAPGALARADVVEDSLFIASGGDLMASGAALDSSAVPSRPGPVMATAPDTDEILLLRHSIGSNWIRVKCREGVFELPEPRLDGAGVSSDRASAYRPRRIALVQGEGVAQPVPPRPIPWQSIESIEVGRSRWRDGMKAGALIGLGLVALEYPIAAAVLSESDGDAVMLLSLAVATIGATVLVTTGIAAPDKRWSVVYVQREAKRRGDP